MSETETTPAIIFTTWLARFVSLLQNADSEAISSLFLPHGWFRDILTFTWDLRALRGPAKIAAYLRDNLHTGTILNVTLEDDSHFRPHYVPNSESTLIESAFRFETSIGHGRGYVQLAQQPNSTWQALLVCMTLADLTGHEEACDPPNWEAEAGGRSWGELHAEQQKRIESDPYVIIVGAGQTGLNVAARFRRMNISTLMIDRNARVGDNWRQRYDTLALHTPRAHHSMLYQSFPSNWPIYTPRDKLADWLEAYSTSQELVIWTKSMLAEKPSWNRSTRRWNVTVNHGGRLVNLRPAHIVVATGTLGAPRMPTIPDQHLYQGTISHAVQFKNAKPYKNKEVIVVGAGNSSIDICQDLVVGGAKSVTMIQRSSTCVTERSNVAVGMSRFWTDGAPTEVGDFKMGSMPLGMLKEYMIAHQEETWALDRRLHAKLRKGGVSLNIGPEGQGQFLLVFERCGGYWLDKGGADLIESGDIKVKQGSAPQAYTSTGMSFQDGTELKADAVIFATGFENVREVSRDLLGADIVDRTTKIYGLDEEGELNGSYRPCGHPGLWFATGDFFHSRYFSKHLALQIKAREIGLIQDDLRASL